MIFKGRNQLDRNCYNVLCDKTKGYFNTTIWDLGKSPRNVCLCCGKIIKNKLKENKKIDKF